MVKPSAIPAVSVVIPAYGHEAYIRKTLQSVFDQTFTDYEVIVVNDGSPDNTEAILKPYVESGQIRLISQANSGVAAARNRGISLSDGEFVALLDDDDVWPPNKLQNQVELLRNNSGAVMVYGGIEYIGADDLPFLLTDAVGNSRRLHCDGPDNPGPSGQVYAEFTSENYIVSPGQTLVRREALQSLDEEPFDTTIWGADDWDLWLRMAEQGEVIYQPELALRYRFHSNNASLDGMKLQLSCLEVLRKHRERQRKTPERFTIVNRAYEQLLAYSHVHFYHLAWLDYDQVANRGGDRRLLGSARSKLLVNARVTRTRCLNAKYFKLVRAILQYSVGYTRNKVKL